MSSINFFAITILSLQLCACASLERREVSEMDQYLEKVGDQVGPVWRSEVKKRVQKLSSRGLQPMDLKSPQNEVVLGLSVAKDGRITDVRPLAKSRYAFLNKAAYQSLQMASPLAPPPASCFKSETTDCDLNWKFIIK
jgi:hypothetical protein